MYSFPCSKTAKGWGRLSCGPSILRLATRTAARFPSSTNSLLGLNSEGLPPSRMSVPKIAPAILVRILVTLTVDSVPCPTIFGFAFMELAFQD